MVGGCCARCCKGAAVLALPFMPGREGLACRARQACIPPVASLASAANRSHKGLAAMAIYRGDAALAALLKQAGSSYGVAEVRALARGVLGAAPARDPN